MSCYRFFFHFNKHTKQMTIHFRGKCHPASHIDCLVPCETKWNKRQPHLVMRGFCKEVRMRGTIAIIM